MATPACTYCGKTDVGKRVNNSHGTFCNSATRKCWIVYKDLKGLR